MNFVVFHKAPTHPQVATLSNRQTPVCWRCGPLHEDYLTWVEHVGREVDADELTVLRLENKLRDEYQS